MPVNSFPAGASPYGALNCGNVREWVDDDQKPTPDNLKKMQAGLDPKLTMEDAYYVIRGGDFGNPTFARVTHGIGLLSCPLASRNIGSRCAKTPDSR